LTTYSDCQLNDSWQNVYTLSGLTPGASITIQNKTLRVAYIQSSVAAPGVYDRSGYQLKLGESITIKAGDTGIWIWGGGLVSVQPSDTFQAGTSGLTYDGGRLLIDVLGMPGVARQLSATTVSSNTALSAACRRITMYARTSDVRFSVGVGAQTASATASHFVGAGERIDYLVPTGANIAIIRDSNATSNATLEITELS